MKTPTPSHPREQQSSSSSNSYRAQNEGTFASAPVAQPGRCQPSQKRCLGKTPQTGKGHEFKPRPGLHNLPLEYCMIHTRTLFLKIRCHDIPDFEGSDSLQ